MIDQPDVEQERRTSLYLVRRAEALLGSLRFFLSSHDVTNRQLQFLAQSDFWEWEMENLIYSFTHFAERAKTWRSSRLAAEKLGSLGIAVDVKVLRQAYWSHGWNYRMASERVAPVDLLRETVDTWNKLIRELEARFIAPMQKKARKYNIQTLKDLSHLRKPMPDLEALREA